MTPEQKERIKKAAHELGAAMTDAGGDFHVRSCGMGLSTLFGKRNYSYSVTVELINREVIA